MNDPEPLPFCPCPPRQAYHDDECPHYLELLARMRKWREEHEPR